MSASRSIRSCIAAILTVLILHVEGGAQSRPVQLDDWYNLKNIGEFSLSPDGRSVAFVVREIDRAKDRRLASLWRIPTTGGSPERLTWEGSAGSPRFSPDGRFLAFVSDRYLERFGVKKEVAEAGQAWALPLAGGEAFPLTALRSGIESFEWSPDSRRLAVLSKDPRDDDGATAESSDAPPPPIVITRLQHKRDGTGYLDLRRRHIHVASVEQALGAPGTTAETRQLTKGPFDDSDPAWSPDGKSIAFSSNRTEDPDANENTDVWVIDAEGGEPSRLTTDPGSDGDPAWSPDGRTLAYIHMPKDPPVYATPRLMTVPTSGGSPRDLTGKFDRHAGGPPRWSADGTAVFVRLEDEGKSPLVRVTLAGVRTVVDAGDIGGFAVRGDVMVALKATPTRPPELYAYSNPAIAGRRLTEIHEPLFRNLTFKAAENIEFKSADGTPVEGWVVKPPDFDASRKYPLILRIHGGPVDQFTDAFSFEHQYLASLGFVVVFVNPRGSNGYGEAFCRAIFADWGNKDFQDVMAGVDHVIGEGYVDVKRLGVGGWSYGGILTNYVITKSTRFAAAVSGASETDMFSAYGVDDLVLWWQRELGVPWRNVDLYRKLSPIMDVEKITTPTLLMVGERDYRVPLPQSEQLYLALKTLKKDTGLIIYPGQSHSISRPSYQIDRLRRYGLWYDKFLKGKDVNPLYEKWKDEKDSKKTTQ
ncbi:MAG TPA: S9 family peptidase [Vicinamibacterales bacterium]|nr:S9 family peptidase [Vicinamibacterales bacterium]